MRIHSGSTSRRLAGDLEEPIPYAEVARMDLMLHRPMFWSRLCRVCHDPWPCARRIEVEAALGRSVRTPVWWLAVPALFGVGLVAAAMAGLIRW